jgi:iron complex transport system permease protein
MTTKDKTKNNSSCTIAEQEEQRKKQYIFIFIILSPLILFIASFVMGRYAIPVQKVFYMLAAKLFHLPQTWTYAEEVIVMQVRMPRILAAMGVGGALALAGASFQGLFKNPMVSPDILGASAGAGFGAAVALLLHRTGSEVQLFAFAFGLIAVGLTYGVSKSISKGNSMILILVLTGMVVGTMFQAMLSIIKYVADPEDTLPTIIYWLMGSLASVLYKDLLFFLIPLLLGAVPLLLLRWRINVLSFGDEEAKAMGINTALLRGIIVVCSTILTAASVSISGMIGWVGLVIPHLARILVGPNYKALLPASLFMGASYLLCVDNIARALMSIEIPLGILTAMIGAPFFIVMLYKGGKGWL